MTTQDVQEIVSAICFVGVMIMLFTLASDLNRPKWVRISYSFKPEGWVLVAIRTDTKEPRWGVLTARWDPWGEEWVDAWGDPLPEDPEMYRHFPEGPG